MCCAIFPDFDSCSLQEIGADINWDYLKYNVIIHTYVFAYSIFYIHFLAISKN